MCLRMNCLRKPFGNVKARRAMLHLIDQEAFLRVMCPEPKYGRALTTIFGNSTPYSNDENTGWYKKGGDVEAAKQLFKEVGYAGERVVILQPADWPAVRDVTQLLAATMRKIGVNAELAPSDWGGIAARRANRGPVEKGGWSIFITSDADSVQSDPIAAPLLAATSEKAWFAWPQNAEYESLRAQWGDAKALDERKLLARKMQSTWWDFVGDLRLRQIVSPIVRRKTLKGLIGMPQLVPTWNMQKG